MSQLPVMEHFYTLQGEGRFQGHPAYFIRLAGCDVGCFWCDVKDSWEEARHPRYTVNEIIGFVSAAMRDGIVVITGGEPLMHNLDELTAELKNSGYRTHLETSGAHPVSGSWDWICLSPKKFKQPLEEICRMAHELKVIVYNSSDFEWAEKHASLVDEKCHLYLQPEWSKFQQLRTEIVEYIKSHPSWILSLQVHKYLEIP